MEFLIGDKVKWKAGTFDMKGLFLEEVDTIYSNVLCIEQSGVRRKYEMKVMTSALEKDND